VTGKITAYVFTVIPEATSTTLTSTASNPSPAGTSITFTATVTSSGVNPPTGNVTFADGSNTLGFVAVNGSGVASYSTSSLIPGLHSITATYSGDANTESSVSSPVSVHVGPQSTTVVVTGQPNPAFVGGTITFTATVTPQIGGTPTGTVTFNNTTSSTVIGTAPLQASGVASLTNTSVATTAGTYTISASYSGDANNNASTTSTSLSETVGAASFVVSISPESQTVTAGNPALYVIAIEPEGNFSTAITLSCPTAASGDLPTQTTCTFTPPTLTPNTSTVTSSLAIATVAETTTSSLFGPMAPGGRRNAPIYTFGAFAGFLAALVILCALLLDGLRKQKRRAIVRFAMAIGLVVAMGMALASCKKSSTTTSTTTGTPAGSYLITITGTSGTTTSSFNVSLTVNAN